VRGRFVPGQQLRLTELGKEYNVSFNVAREALYRLTGEGLVQSVPQQGFSVTRVSLEDLADLTETRIRVEHHGGIARKGEKALIQATDAGMWNAPTPGTTGSTGCNAATKDATSWSRRSSTSPTRSSPCGA
jgi:DNA-binding transcriptional MocR family regulator